MGTTSTAGKRPAESQQKVGEQSPLACLLPNLMNGTFSLNDDGIRGGVRELTRLLQLEAPHSAPHTVDLFCRLLHALFCSLDGSPEGALESQIERRLREATVAFCLASFEADVAHQRATGHFRLETESSRRLLQLLSECTLLSARGEKPARHLSALLLLQEVSEELSEELLTAQVLKAELEEVHVSSADQRKGAEENVEDNILLALKVETGDDHQAFNDGHCAQEGRGGALQRAVLQQALCEQALAVRLLAVCHSWLAQDAALDKACGASLSEEASSALAGAITTVAAALSFLKSALGSGRWVCGNEHVVAAILQVLHVLPAVWSCLPEQPPQAAAGAATPLPLLVPVMALAEVVEVPNWAMVAAKARIAASILKGYGSPLCNGDRPWQSTVALSPHAACITLEYCEELFLQEEVHFTEISPREEFRELVSPKGFWLGPFVRLLEVASKQMTTSKAGPAEQAALPAKLTAPSAAAEVTSPADNTSRSPSSTDEDPWFGNLFAEPARGGSAQPDSSFQAVAAAESRQSSAGFAARRQVLIRVANFLRKVSEQQVPSSGGLPQGSEVHLGWTAELVDQVVASWKLSSGVLGDEGEKAFGQLSASLAGAGVLDEAVHLHLVSSLLGLSWSSTRPTKQPDEMVALAAQLLLRRVQATTGKDRGKPVDDQLVLRLWQLFFEGSQHTGQIRKGQGTDCKLLAEAFSLQQLQVLLLGWHTLSLPTRTSLFKSLLALLEDSPCQDRGEGLSASGRLLTSRLLLVAWYMCTHLERYPAWLPSAIQPYLSYVPGQRSRLVAAKLMNLESSTAKVGRAMLSSTKAEGLDRDFLETLFVLWEEATDLSAPRLEEIMFAGEKSGEVSRLRAIVARVLNSAGVGVDGGPLDQLMSAYCFEVCLALLSACKPDPRMARFGSGESDSGTAAVPGKSIEQSSQGVPVERAPSSLLEKVQALLVLGLETTLTLEFEEELKVVTSSIIKSAQREPPVWDFAAGAAVQCIADLLYWALKGSGQTSAGSDQANEDEELPCSGESEPVTVRTAEGASAVENLLQCKEGEEASATSWLLDALLSLVDACSSCLQARVEHYISDRFGSGKGPLVLRLLQGQLGQGDKLDKALSKLSVPSDQLSKLLLREGSLQGLPWSSKEVAGALFVLPCYDPVKGLPQRPSSRLLLKRGLAHGLSRSLEAGTSGVASLQMAIGGVLSVLIALVPQVRPSQGEEQRGVETLRRLFAMQQDQLYHFVAPQCEELAELLGGLYHTGLEAALVRDLQLLSTVEGVCRAVIKSPVTAVVAEAGPSLLAQEGLAETVMQRAVEVISSLLKDSCRASAVATYIAQDQDSGHHTKEHVTGSLWFLMDALEGCQVEAVNLKVLGCLQELLKLKGQCGARVHAHLYSWVVHMGTQQRLGKWLEERLLGAAGADTGLVWNTPPVVREAASDLLTALFDSTEEQGAWEEAELRTWLVSALLDNLERAFLSYEASAFVAYLGLMVRMACGVGQRPSEVLLERVLDACLALLSHPQLEQPELLSSGQLQCLRTLLSFLATILGLPTGEAQPAQVDSKVEEVAGECAVSGSRAKHVEEAPLQQEHGGSEEGEEECDEDEAFDEDEETEDEGDSADGGDERATGSASPERALSGKVCTFTSSGNNFMEQHWYFCYTCDLVLSKGCCSTCAKVCHRGHKVVYSRLSRFFCDCGAGGAPSHPCACLHPRRYTAASAPSQPTAMPAPPLAQHPADSADDISEPEDTEAQWEMRTGGTSGLGAAAKCQISTGMEERAASMLAEWGLADKVVAISERLFAVWKAQLEGGSRGAAKMQQLSLCGGDKAVVPKSDLLQLKKVFKAGAFDTKVRMEYASARELKAALASGALLKATLSVGAKGKVALGEGDKVSVFEGATLAGGGSGSAGPSMFEKGAVKPVSRNSVRFEIIQLAFCGGSEAHLAVVGYQDVQVWTLNQRGEVTDRLQLELALPSGAFIRQALWLPSSQVELAVVSSAWAKVYDLSVDALSPQHCLTVLEDSIASLSFVPGSQSIALVLTQQGVLYVEKLGGTGERILTESIQLPGVRPNSRGRSLHFSAEAGRLLVVTFEDGQCLMGRLSADCMRLEESCMLLGEKWAAGLASEGRPPLKPSNAGTALHHWQLLQPGSNLMLAYPGQRSSPPVVVDFGPANRQVLDMQQLRAGGSASAPRVDGVGAVTAADGSQRVLVLHEDGSLLVFSHSRSPPKGPSRGGLASQAVKKSVEATESGHEAGRAAPVFPLDFFESTVCVTSEVRFGGDALKGSDAEAVKVSLAAEDGFLEGPQSGAFKLTVLNSNADLLLVGCRIHVGTTGARHIPKEVGLFGRVIPLEEGVRRWYDLPFTSAEAATADKEFTLRVGPAYTASCPPRIDACEVYARSKEEVGWKVVQASGAEVAIREGMPEGSSVKGSSFCALEAAVAAESPAAAALACGLRVLHAAYSHSAARPPGPSPATSEPGLHLLECIIWQDRVPLLQAAARHVLRALKPSLVAYRASLDAMHLTALVSALPRLTSELTNSTTGAPPAFAMDEFLVHMQTVAKISSRRPANMVAFLQREGPSVVKSLLKGFWTVVDGGAIEAQGLGGLVAGVVDLIWAWAYLLLPAGGSQAEDRRQQVGAVKPVLEELQKLLLAPQEPVRAAASLTLSSRFLCVPVLDLPALGAPGSSQAEVSGSGEWQHERESFGVRGRAAGQLEEDLGVASVQYCCDGCNKNPIVKQRWHCDVCPDFDYCEACYRDPPEHPPGSHTHSADHPMTPLPVEEVGGAMYSEHFPQRGEAEEVEEEADTALSLEDASDEALLELAREMSLQPLDAQDSTAAVRRSEEETEAASGQDTVSGSGQASAGQEGTAQRGITAIVRSEGDATAEEGRTTEEAGLSAGAKSREEGRYRQVRSVLLMGLVGDLSWLRGCHGAEALPALQLLYRLAVAGEGFDIALCCANMLDHLDLTSPMPTGTRTPRGEVAVLVFIFLAMVLHNWRQQPAGSSESEGTELAAEEKESGDAHAGASNSSAGLQTARTLLRQQALADFLLVIIKELGAQMKKPRKEKSGGEQASGTGRLLQKRRDFVPGSCAPFFSDAYARLHRGDLFQEFSRLLLESSFRLVYSMVRCEKGEAADEEARRALVSAEAWEDVLCRFILCPHTSYVHKHARRLLLQAHKNDKGSYYQARDRWQLGKEAKRLQKLGQKSGGFREPLPYDTSVKLVRCLTTLAEVASARPASWQRYCAQDAKDALQALLSAAPFLGEEALLQVLKLLGRAFDHPALGGVPKEGSKEKQPKHSPEDGAPKPVDMSAAVELFLGSGDDGAAGLSDFVDCFLLDVNVKAARVEARGVVLGLWAHAAADTHKQAILLKTLLGKLPSLAPYGQNVLELTALLASLLEKGVEEGPEAVLVQRCVGEGQVVPELLGALRQHNQVVANHPHQTAYQLLAGLVEFDGCYLESEPCLACSSPELPYQRLKLESLKVETRYTDNRIVVKCNGNHLIQSVWMSVHELRRARSVRTLNLYYNNRPVADASELKNNWSLWRRARTCHLAPNQGELRVDFIVPISACNLMIEFQAFHDNLQMGSSDSLQCPRCSRSVTDKHGICSNCHENAYQCRQCRNINYENLDSFLCNECGYSKYGRFDFSFMAKPSFAFDAMESEEDMRRGVALIASESENALKRSQQLVALRRPLLKLLPTIADADSQATFSSATAPSSVKSADSAVQQTVISVPSSSSLKINRKVAILGVLYGEKCRGAFESVSRSVQTLVGVRRALADYLERQARAAGAGNVAGLVGVRPPVRPLGAAKACYACANTFLANCLDWLRLLASLPGSRAQLLQAGTLQELLTANIHHGPRVARARARTVVCLLVQGDADATAVVTEHITQKVQGCLRVNAGMDVGAAVKEELALLADMCSLSDGLWEPRLRTALSLLFSAVQAGGASQPPVAEHVILPCLQIVARMCSPPAPPTKSTAPPEGVSQQGQGVQEGASRSVPLSPTQPPARPPPSLPLPQGKELLKGQDTEAGEVLLGFEEWSRGSSYSVYAARHKKQQASKKKGPDELVRKYWLRWRSRMHGLGEALGALEEDTWLRQLLLCQGSQALRVEACGLVEALCGRSGEGAACSVRRLRFLDLLTGLLPAARLAGVDIAADFFELYRKLVQGQEERVYLTARGWLRQVCGLVGEEMAVAQAAEKSYQSMDVSQGLVLQKLINLLAAFLDLPSIRQRFVEEGLVANLLEAVVGLRGLIVASSKAMEEATQQLRRLLDSLLAESEGTKRGFVRACVAALRAHIPPTKGQAWVHILEQLCAVVCPEQPEPVYLLTFNKSHTQEEFIRGSMTKNPYSSAEVGPLMRDVKNKICTQLEMLGLLEDDFGMELLVAGNIISLDLSIRQVYEKVWRPSAGTASGECPPMAVVYRLQGLDGEATERMIESVEDEQGASLDPEVEFGITGEMADCGGLQLLLTRLSQGPASREETALLLRLLRACCKVRSNRRSLLQLGALHVFLERARLAVSERTGGAGGGAQGAEGVLEMVELLALEANEEGADGGDGGGAPGGTADRSAEGVAAVRMFLEKLAGEAGALISEGGKPTRAQKERASHAQAVARILPYLTFGDPAAMAELVGHFEPFLDFAQLDAAEGDTQVKAQQRQQLESFARVCESIRQDGGGQRLRDLLMERGVAQRSVEYLLKRFPPVPGGGAAASEARAHERWGPAMQLPSLPPLLGILKGCATAHAPTQALLASSGALPLLHAIEGVSGGDGKEVRVRAEGLLEAVADPAQGGTLADHVASLRGATKEAGRRRAMARREELLASLGMQRQRAADGAERIVLTPTKAPALQGLEDVDEEEEGAESGAVACMVCREGYRLRPTEMLGAYCFCKRVNLGLLLPGARVEWAYSTVSHFNLIHFSCHAAAKRADAALKAPKKEWDGAALRNSETLCNNLFPIRGPAVAASAYDRCLDVYWDNLSALGRADGGKLHLMASDIAIMLARFATGASFSVESKGGGKASNAQLLPFMVQQAWHWLEQGGSAARRAWGRQLSGFVSEGSAGGSAAGSTTPASSPGPTGRTPPSPSSALGLGVGSAAEESVQLMLVMSLLILSPRAWRQQRLAFLKRALVYAVVQHCEGRPLLPPPPSPRLSPRTSTSDVVGSADARQHDRQSLAQNCKLLFDAAKPMVVYVALVDKLHSFFKGVADSGVAGQSEETEEESVPSNEERWWSSMRVRTRDVTAMVSFGSDFVSFVEKMQGATSAQEALNVMGVVEDLAPMGSLSCDEFVRGAVDGGLTLQQKVGS